MAKKFVRGITDVKTINNQDFDTNNVNDLLSDGQYNYIHRKKGKNEEYHNLTDNIKTISSDNTELLSVTNNNKTTNTATLHPKHDAQKEQVLESTRNTVTINHGTNGTAEKTSVDTNPLKVLEHSNLLTDYGISKTTSGDTTKLGLEYTSLKGARFDLDDLENGKVRADDFANAPVPGLLLVSSYSEGNYTIQRAIMLDDYNNTAYVRRKRDGVWKAWSKQVGDKSVIDDLLAQKQDVLTAGDGLSIDNNRINIKATKKPPETNLNTLGEGVIRGYGFSIDQVPDGNQDHSAAYVTINTSDNRKVQFYIRESGAQHGKIKLYYRFIINGEVTEWKEMVGDKSVIDAAINANTEKINQLTAKVTALEEKVAQLQGGGGDAV